MFSDRSEGGDTDSDPLLWCGLSSGKIRIFDASTWVMDLAYVQTPDRVVCDLKITGVVHRVNSYHYRKKN